MVRERKHDKRFKERRVRFAIEFSRKEVKILVRDEGPGFDAVGKLESADDLSQLSGAGGRGLTLIRNFMDEIQFNDDGNEIRLILKLKSKALQSNHAAAQA